MKARTSLSDDATPNAGEGRSASWLFRSCSSVCKVRDEIVGRGLIRGQSKVDVVNREAGCSASWVCKSCSSAYKGKGVYMQGQEEGREQVNRDVDRGEGESRSASWVCKSCSSAYKEKGVYMQGQEEGREQVNRDGDRGEGEGRSASWLLRSCCSVHMARHVDGDTGKATVGEWF